MYHVGQQKHHRKKLLLWPAARPPLWENRGFLSLEELPASLCSFPTTLSLPQLSPTVTTLSLGPENSSHDVPGLGTGVTAFCPGDLE